jgi:hypothetical protein
MRPLCYLRNFAILALLLNSLSVCSAQTPTSPPSPPPSRDPSTLVKAALHRMEQADDAKTLYTRFDLEHTVNHNKKGKLTSQYTALYEDTWINDLPYKRLVEWNGKPLTGADLAAEQARYDKAVADRQKLDIASRAALMHQKYTNTIIRLNKITTPDYRLTELRQQTLNGQLIHVLEADPQPSLDPAHPIPQQRFEIWITDADPTILHIVCDILDDEPPILHGATYQTEYQLIDGQPLPSHEIYHSYTPINKKIIVVDSEHTYTRYRRFTTTVTLKSTSDPDAAAPPN